MKMLKPFSSLLLLAVAVTVTVGSMYVTVSAAARQDDVGVPVPEPADGFGFDEPAAGALGADVDSGIVPPVPMDAAYEDTLEPDEIRSDRQHHIALDANGGFTGTLSALGQSGSSLAPASSMNVRIIRDGNVIASTISSADGSFSFTGLNEGVVALLAYSDTGLLLFGANLVNDGNAFAKNNEVTPVSFAPAANVDVTVSSAIVSGADLQTARELIFSDLTPGETRFSASKSVEHDAYQYGNGEAGSELVHQAIQLDADGTLRGSLNLLDPRTGRHREVRDLTLHFIRNGELAASTMVQPSGDFEIMGLIPGVHSIVSTGADGTLAMAVDIVGSEVNQAKSSTKYKLTRLFLANGLAAAPANAGNFNTTNADTVSDGGVTPGGGGTSAGSPGSPVAGAGAGGAGAPFGPGGAAPGGGVGGGGTGGGLGGGGGGIGGGGGGIGSLLGAAAAGAIGFAAGRDDASPGR